MLVSELNEWWISVSIDIWLCKNVKTIHFAHGLVIRSQPIHDHIKHVCIDSNSTIVRVYITQNICSLCAYILFMYSICIWCIWLKKCKKKRTAVCNSMYYASYISYIYGGRKGYKVILTYVVQCALAYLLIQNVYTVCRNMKCGYVCVLSWSARTRWAVLSKGWRTPTLLWRSLGQYHSLLACLKNASLLILQMKLHKIRLNWVTETMPFNSMH